MHWENGRSVGYGLLGRVPVHFSHNAILVKVGERFSRGNISQGRQSARFMGAETVHIVLVRPVPFA